MGEELAKLFQQLGVSWEAIGIAIAAFFSILSFIGYIIQFFYNRWEKKKNWSIQYITDKRVDWIYAVRKEASSFLALTRTYQAQQELSPDAFEKICEKVYILELFLNFKGIVDNVLISLMSEILEDMKNRRPIDANERLFRNHLRIYLKVEWNRVKDEAEGKKYTKEKNISELRSAYNSYLEDKTQINGVKSIKNVRDFLEDYKK